MSNEQTEFITISGRVSAQVEFKVPANLYTKYKNGEVDVDILADYCERHFQSDNTEVEIIYYDDIQTVVMEN